MSNFIINNDANLMQSKTNVFKIPEMVTIELNKIKSFEELILVFQSAEMEITMPKERAVKYGVLHLEKDKK
jgi:hypothetical protein